LFQIEIKSYNQYHSGHLENLIFATFLEVEVFSNSSVDCPTGIHLQPYSKQYELLFTVSPSGKKFRNKQYTL